MILLKGNDATRLTRDHQVNRINDSQVLRAKSIFRTRLMSSILESFHSERLRSDNYMKKVQQLLFHDGLKSSINRERLFRFEMKAVIDRLYGKEGREIYSTTLMEELGPINIDFTNLHAHLRQDIPDLDPRTARLFSLWAENPDTKEIVAILRGYYILIPFRWGESTIRDYYFYDNDHQPSETREQTPFYPMVVIASFRTTFSDPEIINALIERSLAEIEEHWKRLRQGIVERVDKDSKVWSRYVLAMDKVIHYTFLIPTMEREIIETLRKSGYRTTGVLQLLASPTLSYNETELQEHLREAQRVLQKKSE
jgi:hypothetical protein